MVHHVLYCDIIMQMGRFRMFYGAIGFRIPIIDGGIDDIGVKIAQTVISCGILFRVSLGCVNSRAKLKE